MATAQVVTVELFKVKELLDQAEATPYFPDGRIKKWNDLGKDTALAQYVCRADISPTNRGGAAAAPSKETSRGGAAAAMWTFLC